jgi:hypothetical protein
MTQFTGRLAVAADVPALTALMEAAIVELERPFLTEAQIGSSRAIMGIDTQLIDDGTYFVVESGVEVAGCGEWSRRATLYAATRHRAVTVSSSTRPPILPACVPCTPARHMRAAASAG